MAMNRVLMLALVATSLALAASQPAWAHPPEEHSAALATVEQPAPDADPIATDEPPTAATATAPNHDDAPPHAHGATARHEDAPAEALGAAPTDQAEAATHEHAAGAAPGHHDEAAALERQPVAAPDHHDEAAPHEHGAEAEPGHHEESGHSHWGDNGANTPLEKALEGLGVYHPLLVHFPIALILAAALAQALNLAGTRGSNADIVRFLVWTGAFGGLAAGLLGWAHAGPMASNEAGVMLTHRWIGTALTAGLFGVAAAVEWHRKSPGQLSALVMNGALFTAAAAVATNGFLGGSLAHGGVNHLMEM